MGDSDEAPQKDELAGPQAGDELAERSGELGEPSGHLREVVDDEPADSVVVDRANDVGTPVEGIED